MRSRVWYHVRSVVLAILFAQMVWFCIEAPIRNIVYWICILVVLHLRVLYASLSEINARLWLQNEMIAELLDERGFALYEPELIEQELKFKGELDELDTR